ncbi:MAG: sugar phosphate isomerase [Verrucomicrobia bacterium]|nr:MAG: sugar phosphate isomerase [Verrucomicrobiota bacterium]
MKLRENPPLHLTYCLNIHPGETWAENLAAIRQYAVAVKQRIAPAKPFGLGLRLSAAAAETLRVPTVRRALRTELDALGLYVFTINGFPFGQFHGTRVKEQVYAPDWRTRERLEYTCLLADILADLLPDGVSGSISTLPGSFKPWIHGADDEQTMTKNLVACARHLIEIEARTGREIQLGLEPEPWCWIETTDEALRFFGEPLRAACVGGRECEGVRRHLGVCLDTCHAAVQFESPLMALRRYRAAGIHVSKIQLSAALDVKGWSCSALRPFDEPVYLHQTKARLRDRSLLAWPDLSFALDATDARTDIERLHVHFHVPLFWPGSASLHSTAAELDEPFFRAACAATEHLEVETYTFSVLPEAMRAGGVVECIRRELEWAQERIETPMGAA